MDVPKYPNCLREQIKRRGYTVQEVAEETNIPLRTLFDYCAGRVPIPKKRLQDIADMIGCSIDSLVPINGVAEQAHLAKFGQEQGTVPLSDVAKEISATLTSAPTEGDISKELFPLLALAITQGIMEAIRELESQDMDKIRRQLLQGVLGITGTLVTPTNVLFNFDLLERLSRALAKPSSIDVTTLRYLEHRTVQYWQDRNDAVLVSHDLLGYVLEHLQRVTLLLEGSLVPTTRLRICSIAGEIAMLVGELFFDMSDYVRARAFHKLAIQAAQEANNQALQAVAWGRMSFAWTYSGNPQAALPCIQEARRLPKRNVNTTVSAWLAAVEAEVRANLGDLETCRKALVGTECVEDQQPAKEDCYWIHFDRSLLAGYQGVCFLRLYNPNDAQRTFLLEDAQQALKEALALLDPALMRRRPNLLIDLAGTYVKQGEIEEACDYALQAVAATAQIKSQVVLQRLISLRHELEPWKDTQYVKTLDERVVPLLTLDWYRGIA